MSVYNVVWHNVSLLRPGCHRLSLQGRSRSRFPESSPLGSREPRVMKVWEESEEGPSTLMWIQTRDTNGVRLYRDGVGCGWVTRKVWTYKWDCCQSSNVKVKSFTFIRVTKGKGSIIPRERMRRLLPTGLTSPVCRNSVNNNKTYVHYILDSIWQKDFLFLQRIERIVFRVSVPSETN